MLSSINHILGQRGINKQLISDFDDAKLGKVIGTMTIDREMTLYRNCCLYCYVLALNRAVALL